MDLYFIPVHMIKTSEYVDRLVYSCAYREHYQTMSVRTTGGGLSLCVQGTLPKSPFKSSATRFIPVYTGNIIVNKKFACEQSVYPCVYREHKESIERPFLIGGLSLCIQGTYDISRFVISNERFIPVYTGNISRCQSSNSGLPVYPCVYREHTNYNILFYN